MKPLIVANWKTNPSTLKKAKELLSEVEKGLKGIKNVEVVICPPFVYLSAFLSRPAEAFSVGGQNCFWEKSGAYTGEVSVSMLKDLGIKYVIVGHSERRRFFGETDVMINKKIKAVLAEGLTPIFCVGEKREQRDEGGTEIILEQQIRSGLEGIKESDFPKIVFAYEPIWAIGTGNACSVRDAKEAGDFMRKALGKEIKILYGGSVNSENASGYLRESNMQGMLVGGASLNAKEFNKIIQSAS